jgi:hypothetical protein
MAPDRAPRSRPWRPGSTNIKKRCGTTAINYTANGTGAGFQAFQNSMVDFAGYDGAPLSADRDRARCRLNVLPMVTRPIAVIYNLESVKSLRLRPVALAKIFSGAITAGHDHCVWGRKCLKTKHFRPQTTIMTGRPGPPLGNPQVSDMIKLR